MGLLQSSAKLDVTLIEEYLVCTFFTRSEILRLYDKFMSINKEKKKINSKRINTIADHPTGVSL